VGYDDSAWASGPSGLGLDVSANGVPIRTTIAYTAQSEPSWYRKHFNFPGSTNGVVLTLRDVVEDSAVYFLNGQEVFRHNVAATTVLNYAARAAAGQVDPTPVQGPFNIPITNLVSGDNVLAVVVIQSGATSSDVELAVELTASIPEFANGPVSISAAPQPVTVNEGQNAVFTVSASGAVPISFQWKKGGVDLLNETNATLVLSPALVSDQGDYSVFVSNATSSTNSPSAHLTVIPDTTAPTILSAVGDTNFSVVVVTLHDSGTGINLASAQDPSHYQIHLTAGGGDLTVSSAVATNSGTNTIVTLTTTAPRTMGQDYTVVLNNVTDRASTPNAVSPNSAPIVATIGLMTFTQVWRYDQSGADLGTAWKESAFNDSGWASGPGVLGFETTSNTLVFLRSIAPPDGTNTILSLTNNSGGGIATGTNFINVTFYFRTTVNVPFDPSVATMRVRAYVDDGAILYVNGQEQLRYNMTNSAGYTNFANGALTEPNPNPVTTFVVTNLSGLVQGNNVIAVEVHQDAIGSSDIDWGMELQAVVASFTGGGGTGPRISASQSGNQMTISWTQAGCSLQETTQLQTPSSSTVWSASAVANGVPFTPSGPMKFYRLSCP
jgi:hypothetical protein